MDDEVEFLAQLRGKLIDRFGEDEGVALFGVAASEFFAGPDGVTAMFAASRSRTGKDIPSVRKTMPK